MNKTFYTPKEVAALLGFNPITVYRWLNSGILRGIRVGPKRWRIPASEIERILQVEHPTEGEKQHDRL